MEEFVKLIAEHLVDNAEEVSLTKVNGKQTTILELRVSKKDVGKLIGRSGKTADAMRTLINCVAAKEQKRYILQIIDSE